MQFNSVNFLFFFFPLFLAVYYITPRKVRHYALFLGNILFYAGLGAGKLWCLAALLILTLLTYLLGRGIAKCRGWWLLGISVTALGGILVFFKLWDGGVWLPAGMSFYLFQMSAYLIDVYRGRAQAEKNFIRYGAETMLFPKLLSGPIMPPKRLQEQFVYPCGCVRPFHRGLQELILGLGLKVLLADRLGGLWAQAAVTGYAGMSTPFAWLALTAYAMRLYFDFYGYSLMAVGIGHMLGFHLPMNFKEPYSAKTVSEFYRCWHVTLGAWFREYIYIPLGGSRRGMLRTVLNLAIVWAFTGFWHGTGGNYLLWALFLFLLIVNERLWLGKLLKRSHVICHIYTVFVILLSWLPFAVGDWQQLTVYACKLFGFGGAAVNVHDYLAVGRLYLPVLCAGVLFATPLPKVLWKKVHNTVWADVFLFILFWVVVYFICTSAQDPFMYFQY